MTAEDLATMLRKAEKKGVPCAPIRNHIDAQDIKTAYAVQHLNIDHKRQHGQAPVGKKIGLTSKKVQAQLGVDQPDFGVLLDGMQFKNNGSISMSELMQPKAEAEVAFVLKKDLVDEVLTLTHIKEAIDYAVAAIEITGSRITNWDITIADTIADNASSSHFVLGDKKMTLSELDLENGRMQLDINGKTVSEGRGKACLGNPLNAVLWLARKMQEFGDPLKAGEIILSGALGPMVEITKGDTVKTHIDGLGQVAFNVG